MYVRRLLLGCFVIINTVMGNIIIPKATTFAQVMASIPLEVQIAEQLVIDSKEPIVTPPEGLYVKGGLLRTSSQLANSIEPRPNEVLIMSHTIELADNTELIISRKTKFLTIMAVNLTIGDNVKITYQKNDFKQLRKPATPLALSPPHGYHWSIWCKGRSPGATGTRGVNGANGADGADAPGVQVIAWRMNQLPDFDLKGQDGQHGQEGGNGAAGQCGKKGKAASVGWAFCKNQHGEGCNGGRGGPGGGAGGGGDGGYGGYLSVVTSEQALLLLSGHNVNLGFGKGGSPGVPGDGGRGGCGGDRGNGHSMCLRSSRRKGDNGASGAAGARGTVGHDGQTYSAISGQPNYVRKKLPEDELQEFRFRWAQPSIKCTYAHGSSCQEDPGVSANQKFEVEGLNFLPNDVADFFIGGFNVVVENSQYGPNRLEFVLPQIVTSRKYALFTIRRQGSDNRGSLFEPGPRDGVSNLGYVQVRQ